MIVIELNNEYEDLILDNLLSYSDNYAEFAIEGNVRAKGSTAAIDDAFMRGLSTGVIGTAALGIGGLYVGSRIKERAKERIKKRRKAGESTSNS
jgi:hypothetical protein